MRTLLRNVFIAIMLFVMPALNFGQLPNLGTTASFALFTASGAFNEFGSASSVTGNVGTNAGAFNLFPPGSLNGQIYIANAVSAQAATDVAAAFSFLAGITPHTPHAVLLGNGETLLPGVYFMGSGAAATLNGNLILNGNTNPNAIFIFQIDGAFETSAGSTITMTNSASLCNVFWQVNGAVQLGAGSVFKGNILGGGAIHLLDGVTLQGRGLTTAGEITLYNNTVTMADCAVPPGTIPTLSEWGLIILGILLLGAGAFYILRRRQTSLSI